MPLFWQQTRIAPQAGIRPGSQAAVEVRGRHQNIRRRNEPGSRMCKNRIRSHRIGSCRKGNEQSVFGRKTTMNELFKTATRELERFLSSALPVLEPQWWQKLVLDRLSFQQQRIAQERRFSKLADLDLAALLRVFDQNWFELSSKQSLPREARSWIKELQTVRNKWAHLPSDELPASESFRDADTLGRLLGVINASSDAKAQVEAAKALALGRLTSRSKDASPEPGADGEIGGLFAIGQLVGLRVRARIDSHFRPCGNECVVPHGQNSVLA